MFPKFTPLQGAIALAVLAFYGFAVFALTRDYYLRHPPRAAAIAAMPDPRNAALGARLRSAARDAETDIPAELVAADPVLLAREADRLFAARRFAEAITLYRKALERDPNDADARNDLGLALHYAGNTAEGLEVLRAGTESAPEFQRLWLSLGFVAAAAGRTEQARAALAKAGALDPDSDIGAEAQRLSRQLDAQ